MVNATTNVIPLKDATNVILPSIYVATDILPMGHTTTELLSPGKTAITTCIQFSLRYHYWNTRDHWMRDTTTDVLHLREIATFMLPLGDKTSKELPLRDITIEK